MGYLTLHHIPESYLYMIRLGLPAILGALLLLGLFWAFDTWRKQRSGQSGPTSPAHDEAQTRQLK